MESLYNAPDFAGFLRRELEGPRFGRGAKSSLAQFLGVQSSLISLALSGTQSFSLEQGLRIAEFLGLTKAEAAFALLLLQRDRAGSKPLRDHFQSQIDLQLEERRRTHTRIRSVPATLAEADLHEYYGCWFHTAVHMAVRNPKHKTASSIARTLGIGANDVRRSLALLVRLGFVAESRGTYKPTHARFHVPRDSSALRVHYLNWRLAATRSLDAKSPEDLHYSLVMSVDQKAIAEIRKILLGSIESIEPVIEGAEDRRVYALNFDLFAVDSPEG